MPTRLKPLPFPEAIAFLRRRGVVLPPEFYGSIPQDIRNATFTVSGLAALSQIQHVKDALDAALADGLTFRQWKDRVRSGAQAVGLPDWRLETIYRTNMQSAWNQGRLQWLDRNKDTHPFWRYVAIEDARTRPHHLAMHGTVLPSDHPWWRSHYPPNGYNCRCKAIGLTQSQAERRGITSVPGGKPDMGWAYDKIGTTITDAVKDSAGRALQNFALPGMSPIMRRIMGDGERAAGKLAGGAAALALANENQRRVIRELVEKAMESGQFRRLSEDHITAVAAYSSEGYRPVNGLLRYLAGAGRKPDPVEAENALSAAGAMIAGLERLPAHSVATRRTLTQFQLPRGWDEAHQPGAIVRYNGFTSASGPQGDPRAGGISQVIIGRTPRHIRGMTALHSEDEYLFLPGTLFRVVARDGDHMVLKELAPGDVPRETIHDFNAED